MDPKSVEIAAPNGGESPASPGWLTAAGVPASHAGRPLIGIAACLPAGPGVGEAVLQAVERSVRLAGGTPARIPLASLVGAWADGPAGLSYQFLARTLAADTLEGLARSGGFSGLALVAGENEAAAGLLLGALRLGLPALLVPARAVRESGGGYPQAAVTVLAEALGATLPLAATVPSGSAAQMELASAAGRRLVELVREGTGLRRTLMANAFANAARVDAALGGCVDAAVHLLALSQEAGSPLGLARLAELGAATPQVCRITGASGESLSDFHAAGGLPALRRLCPGPWLPHPTVSGVGVNVLIREAQVKSPAFFHLKSPFRAAGGLVVLAGNLAVRGALWRVPRKSPAAPSFGGPARVFNGSEAALAALAGKQVRKGDVLVVRYEGPRGGLGFRPLKALADELAAQGLADSVPLITDGRLGAAVERGVCVELVSPEAADGSPLGVLRDGDPVIVDLARRQLSAHVTDMEFKVRLARWQAPDLPGRTELLARYARQARGALEGGALR